MKYLYIDDQEDQREEFTRHLREWLHVSWDPVVFRSVREIEAHALRKGAFDEIAVALVDLELGPRAGQDRTDVWGGSKVLPLLRQHAPWIPTICFSQYLENGESLALAGAFGFDGLLSKLYVQEGQCAPKDWHDLCRGAALARVAHLTGRSLNAVDECQRRRIELKAPEEVRQLFLRDGEEKFRLLLCLLLPPCKKIVLDPIVQGFSGLYVVRAHCTSDSARSTWLVKWGTEIRKLQEEAAAHRRMFEDGFTREYSLPQLWSNVVAWDNLGGIAYEFAEGAGSLLDLLPTHTLAQVADLLTPMLQRLYRGSHAEREHPLPYLQRLVPKVLRMWKGENYGKRVAQVCDGSTASSFGQSIDLVKGNQHGDLHARNILVVDGRPLLIDLVHYRNRDHEGLPLLDLAKLLVDFCAFGPPEWIDLNAVMRGTIFQGPSQVLLKAALNERETMKPEEATFWSTAVCCLLAEYSTYSDLSNERRDQFLAALRAPE